jgi:Ca-activated chloride channel family protein
LGSPHPGRQGRRPLQEPERRGGACPRPGRRKALPYILAFLLTGCGGGELRFVDLWLTQDQQGQRAFDRGDYAAAAEHFEEPLRKGTALYLTENFEAALAEFAKLDTAEAWFNRGNALAHLERYEEALEAYQRALELRPDYPWAQANLEYMKVFQPPELEGGEMGTVGRDAAADEIVFDADRQRLDEEGIDTVMEEGQEMISDQQLADIWLRQVDTSPTSFLRYKFAYQAQSPGEEENP